MDEVQTLLKETAAEMEKLLSGKTVVGEPITVNGTTLIPLMAIGFGFGAGGGSGKGQAGAAGEGTGGGTGAGGGIKPVAVIIINADGVRVERVGNPGMLEQVGNVAARVMNRGEARPKE